MRISIIVAQSTNRVIGVDGELPWRLPEDLRRFREITMGKPIVMGRATWESIGRALPGRQNIVMSRNPGFTAVGCDVAQTLDEALRLAGDAAELMVIGGGRIYEQFLPLAKTIYLTTVKTTVKGDTSFPALDEQDWQVVQTEEFPVTDTRPLAWTFSELERRDAV